MSEATDREQPADDQDIEIVSLPDRPGDTQFIAPVSSPARPSLAPRFTPRQRRLQLIVTISVIMLALEINLFYIQLEPAWGKVAIDRHTLAHVPMTGTGPLRLSPGHYTLQWIAAPFVTQRCYGRA